jgi:uncharacterized protein YecE (DUF72 family)
MSTVATMRPRAARRTMGCAWIGVSGWRYAPWRGKFYPKGLPQRAELSYVAGLLRTVELNGSFYSLQRPEYYRRWRDETPDGFVFAVKGSRYLTHMRRLRDVESPLANFFASGVLCLEEKLGPFLWQVPATLPCELDRFDAFFSLLPRDTFQAATLASRHEPWLRGRVAFDSLVNRPLRHAVEVRSPTCATAEFVALVRRHGIALVVADTARKFPYLEDVTADFVYVRLHGDEEIYASGYSKAAIARWAKRVSAWRRGSEPEDARRASNVAARKLTARDVYVYFDNDVKVHAPFDALALVRALDENHDALARRSRLRA